MKLGECVEKPRLSRLRCEEASLGVILLKHCKLHKLQKYLLFLQPLDTLLPEVFFVKMEFETQVTIASALMDFLCSELCKVGRYSDNETLFNLADIFIYTF